MALSRANQAFQLQRSPTKKAGGIRTWCLSATGAGYVGIPTNACFEVTRCTKVF